MPIFEYVCNSCGHRFEKLHKSGTEAEASCPTCSGTELSKELSSFSAVGKSDSGCYSGGSTGGG